MQANVSSAITRSQSDAIMEAVRQLRSAIPEGVELVAVSKFHPAAAVRAAYDAGQLCFGESRVQELVEKAPMLPSDIMWHFIGHLQTNKVRMLLPHVAMIESVDSEKLLDIIDAEARKAGLRIKVLMQVHVAREETKFGFIPDELTAYFAGRRFETLTNTHICGLMGMASNTDDINRVKADFGQIARLFDKIKNDIAPDLRGFDRISMGMSHDWPLAVEQGSNMVRIGTDIFGERQY